MNRLFVPSPPLPLHCILASCEHGGRPRLKNWIIFPAQIDSQQVTTNMKLTHCVMQLQIVRWGFNAREGLATV